MKYLLLMLMFSSISKAMEFNVIVGKESKMLILKFASIKKNSYVPGKIEKRDGLPAFIAIKFYDFKMKPLKIKGSDDNEYWSPYLDLAQIYTTQTLKTKLVKLNSNVTLSAKYDLDDILQGAKLKSKDIFKIEVKIIAIENEKIINRVSSAILH